MLKTFTFSTILFLTFLLKSYGQEDCSTWPALVEPTHSQPMVAELCNGQDTGVHWGDYEREMILDAHNYYRGQTAHGCSEQADGSFAPPARNMKKFVYNCSLEATAKLWADHCIWAHSNNTFRNNAGENMYMRTESAPQALEKTRFYFFEAVNRWWEELIEFGADINATDTTLKSNKFSNIGHWSAMAWAKTYSVGCAVGLCQNGTRYPSIVVCQYWEAGNAIGRPIYDAGTPCQTNDDCTIPGWRTCDPSLGLCDRSPLEDEPTYPCQGEDTGVSFKDPLRQEITQTINQRRSELAKGLTVKKDGSYAPKAVNLPKVEYSCELEALAQDRSSSCPQLAPPGDETIYQVLNRDWGEHKPELFISEALEAWWSEIQTADASVNITAASTRFQSYAIRNWATMAAQSVYQIGCGYSVCINQYEQQAHTVVCKYRQNVTYFSDIYKVGEPCTQDSECTLAGFGFCDVKLGLCSAKEVVDEPEVTTKVPEKTTAQQGVTTTAAPTTKAPSVKPSSASTTVEGDWRTDAPWPSTTPKAATECPSDYTTIAATSKASESTTGAHVETSTATTQKQVETTASETPETTIKLATELTTSKDASEATTPNSIFTTSESSKTTKRCNCYCKSTVVNPTAKNEAAAPIKTTPEETTTTTTIPNPCATGWFHFAPTNGCYRYVNGKNRTQAEAETWCVNQGKKGHLASIHSLAENNFIKSLIPAGIDNILIGYNNQAWTDSTPYTYNNWLDGSSINACGALIAPEFQWKSVPCSEPFPNFVCKRNV